MVLPGQRQHLEPFKPSTRRFCLTCPSGLARSPRNSLPVCRCLMDVGNVNGREINGRPLYPRWIENATRSLPIPSLGRLNRPDDPSRAAARVTFQPTAMGAVPVAEHTVRSLVVRRRKRGQPSSVLYVWIGVQLRNYVGPPPPFMILKMGAKTQLGLAKEGFVDPSARLTRVLRDLPGRERAERQQPIMSEHVG